MAWTSMTLLLAVTAIAQVAGSFPDVIEAKKIESKMKLDGVAQGNQDKRDKRKDEVVKSITDQMKEKKETKDVKAK